MKFTVCPFCGVVSENVHDSQEACIRALQSEIDQTRQVLVQFGEPVAPDGTVRRPDPRVEKKDGERS